MKWHANSPVWHPPYQTPCMIRTRDGEEYEATLIHLNDRYFKKVKDKDVWIVKGHRGIKDSDVVEWRFDIDI